MQLLQTQPDGLHLCLLDDVEVALLRCAGVQTAWREEFLWGVYALPLGGDRQRRRLRRGSLRRTLSDR